MAYDPASAGETLRPAFFDRPASDVARDLLGCLVVVCSAEGDAGGVIVETEAYFGPEDPGSHASTRAVTPRNAVMYAAPGTVFVYFTYGNHNMLNFVCGAKGTASAVLVRAIEPTVGVELIEARRGQRPARELTNGPGKVAQALGVDLGDNASVLGEGRIAVYAGTLAHDAEVATSGRIGLSKGHEPELRYYLSGNPFVSRGKPGPLKRSTRTTIEKKERQ